jgi:hypothetical protein
MAINEILRTAFGPKYSLTISVIMNSIGHNKTPQVKVIVNPFSPKKSKGLGISPTTFSRENNFPPMHSAMSALATKNVQRTINNLVGLSVRILDSMPKDKIKKPLYV